MVRNIRSLPLCGFPSVPRKTRIRLLYEICKARHLSFLFCYGVCGGGGGVTINRWGSVLATWLDDLGLWWSWCLINQGLILSSSPIPARGCCNGCHEWAFVIRWLCTVRLVYLHTVLSWRCFNYMVIDSAYSHKSARELDLFVRRRSIINHGMGDLVLRDEALGI